MFKLWTSIKKEYVQLINDKIGLLLMFVMPLLLVLTVTIIQDSAFEIVNEKKLTMLIINKDLGEQGKELIRYLEESKSFEIETDNLIEKDKIKNELLRRSKHIALLIPKDFSLRLSSNTNNINRIIMSDLGLGNSMNLADSMKSSPPIDFYYDPILQENYCNSIINMIYTYLDAIETSLMLENMYANMGLEGKSKELKNIIIDNKIKINKLPATINNFKTTPNSTQHNVPAWTLFAMFFMVISLGGNVVKEKINGSFIRIKTMPTSFAVVLISKMIIYFFVALLQVTVIFSIGIFIFPFLDLNQLVLPSNTFAFIVFIALCSMSAVSYSLLVGSLSKTVEQSNGFGAISVIILAAIGGVWIPIFVMPEYMQTISIVSPLQWCMEGFYILFLKGGNWHELSKVILSLSIFIIFCQIIAYLKLKKEKII